MCEEALRIIPTDYYKYLNVFNKIESNTFPNYYLYDYKINFKNGYYPKELGYNLLYKIFLNELEAVRKYILENFSKGFIKINLLFWATLILFVKKVDGSFYFYVDY